jgi:hypothetical protein
LLVETYELLIVGRSPTGNSECVQCVDYSQMVSPETGSRLLGVTQREIFRYIESGAVHFSEEDGGSLLVCLRSLTVSVKSCFVPKNLER